MKTKYRIIKTGNGQYFAQKLVYPKSTLVLIPSYNAKWETISKAFLNIADAEAFVELQISYQNTEVVRFFE